MSSYTTGSKPKFKKKVFSVLSVVVLGTFLTACSPRVTVHGNYPREDQMVQFEEGKTNQQTIFQTLGAPTSKSSFDQEVWYYMTQEFTREAFFEPELTDMRVIAFYFDDKGIYQTSTSYDLDDVQRIAFEKEVTETSGNSYTLLQQLFGTLTRTK